MQNKNYFSIITPFYNGEIYLENYLYYLSQVNIPYNIKLEVILIDNGSIDQSFEKAKKYIRKYSRPEIIYHLKFYNNKKSSYAARNFGANFARGSWFIFTDVDCIFSKNFFHILYKQLKNNSQKELIAGNVKLYYENSFNIYEVYDMIFGFNMNSYVKEKTGVTANLTTSKQCFKIVGGFDEFVSGADRSFCKNAYTKNCIFTYNEDLVIYHPTRKSYNEIKIKILRIAKGKSSYLKRKSFFLIILYMFKNFIFSIFQLHQFKTLIRKYHIYKHISLIGKIKLICLAFYFGILGRASINIFYLKALINKN